MRFSMLALYIKTEWWHLFQRMAVRGSTQRPALYQARLTSRTLDLQVFNSSNISATAVLKIQHHPISNSKLKQDAPQGRGRWNSSQCNGVTLWLLDYTFLAISHHICAYRVQKIGPSPCTVHTFWDWLFIIVLLRQLPPRPCRPMPLLHSVFGPPVTEVSQPAASCTRPMQRVHTCRIFPSQEKQWWHWLSWTTALARAVCAVYA